MVTSSVNVLGPPPGGSHTQPPSAGPHATPPPGLPLSTAPSQSLSRRSQASATGPVSPVQPPHTPPVQVWVPATHSPMSLPHARIAPPEHGGSASAGAPSVGAPSIRAPSVAPSLVAPSGAGLASDPSPVSLSPHAARTPRPNKNTTAERVKDATRIDP